MDEIGPVTLRRCQEGDHEAFEELVRVYEGPISATIYRLMGGCSRSELEDYTQDVFLKVYECLHRFETDRGVKFSTWLFTILRNHCYNQLKKRARRSQTIRVDDGIQLPAEDGNPREHYFNQRRGQQVGEAVQRLPEDQRWVIVLRFYENLSYDEIGETLGLAVGTVKSRLYRAKETLRTMLSNGRHPAALKRGD